jgi:hypothetical protein
MEVAQRIEGLLHDHGGLGLCEELLLCNVIEELASLAHSAKQ